MAKAEVRRLGIKRVAAWCGVSEWAVYQWFARATDRSPVPLRHMSAIVIGARDEGVALNLRALWPSMPELSA